MFLGDYFQNINNKYKKFFFSGLSFESKKIKKNYIFFAIKGNNVDGNNYIQSAIKKGSKIIVSERKKNKFYKGILFINTKNIRKLLAEVSFKIFNNRPNNLIAVTGTNGKSSIAEFYYQILKLNNKKVASIGTLGVKSKNNNLNLSNTTTDPIQLGQILERLKNQKIDNVIMEASSHGLKQNRLDGLRFNSGIFTNLSQDHLDYHKNLNDYLKSKLYLFKNLIKKRGNVITDEEISEFKKIKKITIKKKFKLHTLSGKNNFKILSHSFKGECQILKIQHNKIIKDIKINLIGKIQLKNLLMSIIAANQSNLKITKILRIIHRIKSVEGRFQQIGKLKNQSRVILDYAHTPKALETCLLNLREQFPDKKISLLFGCGGNRDQNKRAKMGKVADNFSDKIYLTDDNPRFESPNKIRKDIKKGIIKQKPIEIRNRAKAISEAIKNITIGEILLVAGKGHEKIQDFGNRKIYFSDKSNILSAIKNKNNSLSNNFKLNIIKELSSSRKFKLKFNLQQARINSEEVKKGDIFFAIKGKKNDGNKFVGQSFKKGASLAIVNKIQRKFDSKNQLKVKNTLEFLTNSSKILRKNINTKIIAITGSCGKTTLKELLGDCLRKISKVSISPKSYNNKYGVPLSLFNLNKNDEYGVLEVGMDKKGEIDYLSKIIQPDVSVITNISYAHAKNFKNINHIALAKSEIINNTRTNGFIVLNADDSFFNFHKKLAYNKNLKVVSFGIKSQSANIKLVAVKKENQIFRLNIKVNNKNYYFLVSNNFQNNIYNILASLAVMSIYFSASELNKKIFLNFKNPKGRGDLSKLKLNNKNVNLIDESYNSNPLSLKSAILNYDKIDSKNAKKYLLIGDMLELGKHAKKLHDSIVPIINRTKIDKVFVKGNRIPLVFNKLSRLKKGRILYNKSQILDFIKNDLNNNDYLMVKASNATGLNKIVNQLKGLN